MGVLGAAMVMPPALCVMLAERKTAWFMLFEWVTEGKATQVTPLMPAASGVPTKMLCPLPAVAGADEIEGLTPANR